jgi:hypothetical protein
MIFIADTLPVALYFKLTNLLYFSGKSRLKYDMRSHNEMVVLQMKQMSEENQQLHFMKKRMIKTEQYKKSVEGSFSDLAQKYREIMEEKKVLIHRVGEKHLEYEEEVMIT